MPTASLAGYYTFFGHVTDEHPEGMVIFFGGGTSSMPGQSVAVNADGSFFFSIQLQTNGSDAGSVEAWTIDDQGVVSQIAKRGQPHRRVMLHRDTRFDFEPRKSRRASCRVSPNPVWSGPTLGLAAALVPVIALALDRDAGPPGLVAWVRLWPASRRTNRRLTPD